MPVHCLISHLNPWKDGSYQPIITHVRHSDRLDATQSYLPLDNGGRLPVFSRGDKKIERLRGLNGELAPSHHSRR